MTGLFLALGGLCGALGVALSAYAAHGAAGPTLATGAHILLVHAPAFLALAALFKVRAIGDGQMAISATLLSLGLVLFAGDMVFRAFTGARLFAMAAPIGGALLILGWLSLAMAGFAHVLRKSPPDCG